MRHTAQFALPSTVDIARRLSSITDELRQFRLAALDGVHATLRRRANWATWGERVQVDWEPRPDCSVVTVEVTPALATTLHDWGQARRDLRKIEAHLRSGRT